MSGAAPAPAGYLTVAEVQRLLTRMKCASPEVWAPLLVPVMQRYGITTAKRVKPFLATLAVETGGLSKLYEGLNYRPEALRSQWPSHFTASQAQLYGRTDQHPANQEIIANLAYGGRYGNNKPGDGWLFRGRGPTMLTFRGNYRELGAALNLPLEDQPDLAASPAIGALIAAYFWQSKGCNALADRGDIEGWRAAINGGGIGLTQLKLYLAQMG